MNVNTKNKIFVERLFPNVYIKNLQDKIMIDTESMSYISIPYDAYLISNIIRNHVIYINYDPNKMVIMDGTAGVGGNTISFSEYFSKIIAVEIDNKRFKYLKNNIDVYKLNNVETLNCDCRLIEENILNKIDIIFLDPPWGGKDYKNVELNRLYLGNISIEDQCLKFSKYSNIKFIVLKLPLNYDIKYMKDKFKYKFDIYVYELRKMLIIIIDLYN